MISARSLVAVLLCLSLSGCYVKLNGNQSTTGGTATTATSSQVSGSAKFSGGRVGISSGQRIAAGAQGGTVRLSGNAAAVLVVGVVIADFFQHVAGWVQPRPMPAGTTISETCSCYQEPVNSEQ